MADAASLPIGAVVLASDGADNSGGVDLETISEIRRQRIPIHTIGFGKEHAGARCRNQRRADSRARASRFAPVRHRELSIRTATPGRKAKLTVKEGAKILAQQIVTLKKRRPANRAKRFCLTPGPRA